MINQNEIAITDAQMLSALRQAYFKLAMSGAQSYTINGRSYTAFDLDRIQKAIVWMEGRIDLAANPNGQDVLVKFW